MSLQGLNVKEKIKLKYKFSQLLFNFKSELNNIKNL